MQTDRCNSKFLEGPRIYLRSLEEQDVDGPYLQWLNDAEVCAGNSHHVFPYSRAQALQYVRDAALDVRNLILAIVDKADSKHIGNVSLTAVHPLARTAQFSILLGAKDKWNKGYGLEAGRLIISHGFNALNLQRIECGTFSSNMGMRKLALALGMKQEGVRRQAVWKAGRYEDVIEFGLLRTELS